MRTFEFARKMEDSKPVIEPDERNCTGEVKAFPDARLPEYQTINSAGADFFCAEEVTIPSIWSGVAHVLASNLKGFITNWVESSSEERAGNGNDKLLKPTLIHTGIKASMEHDEVLELYNRSSFLSVLN